MNLIDSEITDFYNQSSEESRLTVGLGPLEFERNKDLISRYLPDGKSVIADVGGGTGHYAYWLSSMGHEVKLIDPVVKHIQQAEKRSRNSKNAFKVFLGDARTLPIESRSVDLVILHGPLYHLSDQIDRLAAIREASRIIKLDGIILGFAITHAASTLATLHNGLIQDNDIFAMCRLELESGEHHPSEVFPGMLPRAFFHRPSELIDEFDQAGLYALDLLAVEGMVWMDRKYFDSWASPQNKRRLLDLIKLTEGDRDLLCVSPHIMIAAALDHSK
jgi:2-polyprenyl-3-methyl-5-hydroxy-6-metoxy-1,4-benzoquinol methylase